MRLSTSLAFAASATLAAAAWDCKLDNYDLTPLAGVKTVTHDVDTPPSTTRRIVRINLCDQLGKEDKVADEDQVGVSFLHASTLPFTVAFLAPPSNSLCWPTRNGLQADPSVTAMCRRACRLFP